MAKNPYTDKRTKEYKNGKWAVYKTLREALDRAESEVKWQEELRASGFKGVHGKYYDSVSYGMACVTASRARTALDWLKANGVGVK